MLRIVDHFWEQINKAICKSIDLFWGKTQFIYITHVIDMTVRVPFRIDMGEMPG
jgi:hypothetical protein